MPTRLYLICLLSALPACATSLIFDISSAGNQIPQNSSIVQNYGDRVTGTSIVDGTLTYGYGATGGFTPNVLVSYGPASVTSTNTVTGCPFNLIDTCLYLWDNDFGGLTNVIAQAADEQNNDYGRIELTFTADAGFSVSLLSLDLAGWLRTDRGVRSVEVFDGANTSLFLASNLTAPGVNSLTLTPNVSASLLRLVIDAGGLSGNNSQNVGLDNVVFSQTAGVPEPSTFAMLGAAIAGLGLLRRRR